MATVPSEGLFGVGLSDVSDPSGPGAGSIAQDPDGPGSIAAGEVDSLVIEVLTIGADSTTDAGCPDPLPADVQDAVVDLLEALPPGPDVARLLAVLDAERLSGACLVAVMRAGERQVSQTQAMLVEHTARFARPGVAVPVRQLVDALIHGDGKHRIVGPDPLGAGDSVEAAGSGGADGGDAESPRAGDGAASSADPAGLLGHPVWGPALLGEAQRMAAPEVAVALTLSPITAGKRIAEAVEFTTELAPTLLAWRAGVIDRCRAWTIADATSGLPAGIRLQIQERVLPRAPKLTPGRLRALVGRVAIEVDPVAAKDRLEEAKSQRQVTLRALRDGLARLAADLPADQALLAFRMVDELAEALPETSGDHRGIAERRADVLADLLTTLATHGHIDLRGAGESEPSVAEPDATGSGTDSARDAAGGSLPGDGTDAADPGDGAASEDERDGTRPSGVRYGADSPDPGDGAEPAVAGDGAESADSPDGTDSPDERDATRPSGVRDGAGTTAPAATSCPSCGHLLPVRRQARSWRSRRGPVHVDVIVAASTLAHLDEQPAQLAGLGAIPADLARSLAASAASIRAVLQPPDGGGGSPDVGSAPGTPGHTRGAGGCGASLDYGRTVYRPPAALDRYIRDRDRTCRFPGCRQPAWRCDLDHREPYAEGGATCPCNLDALCRHHHRAKTFTDWSATRDPDGTLRWRSPLGQRVTAEREHHPTDSTPYADDPNRAGSTGESRAGAAPAYEPPPF